MAGLKEVIERRGIFCALYSDRGSHFWLTPKAGGKIDPYRLTQVGHALRELEVQMIPVIRRRAGPVPNAILGRARTLTAGAAAARDPRINDFSKVIQLAWLSNFSMGVGNRV